MHLHIGELLLAAVYMAAAFFVLVAIFRSHAHKQQHTPVKRHELPPVKRVEQKPRKKLRKAA